MAGQEIVASLAEGTAFVHLAAWRAIMVSGPDALGWLNDLVSADLSGLEPGETRPSLLLSPTGTVRAAFGVTMTPEREVLLLQDGVQPGPVDGLLAPYVLSSDVALADRSENVALFAFPGRATAPEAPGAWISAPSCLGAGLDLVAPGALREGLSGSLGAAFAFASEGDLERWRIMAGIPRWGVDGAREDLPQECGLADRVSFDKGCYLGQEAMAKVHHRGHPRRVLMHLVTEQPVGATVTLDGGAVGEVTSKAFVDGRWFVLARVPWERVGDASRGEGGSGTARSPREIPKTIL